MKMCFIIAIKYKFKHQIKHHEIGTCEAGVSGKKYRLFSLLLCISVFIMALDLDYLFLRFVEYCIHRWGNC